MYDVIIIGGGAAGMMAAGTAASYGKKVLVAEKNKMLGRKLLITGKGRCNVTNCADVSAMMKSITTNGKFLYSAFSQFDSSDTVSFFENLGTPLKTERGGRIFPKSDKSSDIVNALKKYISYGDVTIENSEAVSIQYKDGAVCGVTFKNGKSFSCRSVIIACGGLSYPLTGSTGDGYRFAETAGHTIIPPKASLVPLNVKEQWVKDLQGLSLKNVRLCVYKNGKEIFSDFGEMLFTHFGVSGPLVLSASCHMRDFNASPYVISIDLKPALDEKTLDLRILRDFEKFANKNFSNALSDLLPSKLIPVIISLSGIDSAKRVNQITKEERSELVYILKNLEFTAVSPRPIDEAIITSGGVCVKEVNPSTMESKIVSGLFFAGEVLDVDAYTGGYNLQIAFSTGYIAGISC